MFRGIAELLMGICCDRACGTIFPSFEAVDFYFQPQVLSKFVSICKMT